VHCFQSLLILYLVSRANFLAPRISTRPTTHPQSAFNGCFERREGSINPRRPSPGLDPRPNTILGNVESQFESSLLIAVPIMPVDGTRVRREGTLYGNAQTLLGAHRLYQLLGRT